MQTSWPPVEPASSAARASLKRLTSAVAVAGGLAHSGRAIDLTGLDSIAGLLCAQVLDLPPADGHSLRSAMVALNENVAGLLASLRASR